MKIYYEHWLPELFKTGEVTLWPFFIVFKYKKENVSNRLLVHAYIHVAQQKEMLVVFFLLWYGIEWFIRFLTNGFDATEAYLDLKFEREAYNNWEDVEYLEERKHYAWLEY